MPERLDRVFVDTNELFPFTVMDLVLTLAEHRLIEFVWTDELLLEWERVIVREGQRDTASAQSVAAAVRRFFAESRIDPATYRTQPWPELPDPHDRVHGAAAIAGAEVLLLDPGCVAASSTAMSVIICGHMRTRVRASALVSGCAAGGRPAERRGIKVLRSA